MKDLIIETESRQTVVKSIPIPAFFKTKYGALIGLINPESVYRIFHNETFTNITNATSESMKSDLQEYFESEIVTEYEFMKVYNAAREATDLNPTLIYD